MVCQVLRDGIFVQQVNDGSPELILALKECLEAESRQWLVGTDLVEHQSDVLRDIVNQVSRGR